MVRTIFSLMFVKKTKDLQDQSLYFSHVALLRTMSHLRRSAFT